MQGMFAYAFSWTGDFFRIFWINIFLSYGEFKMREIKLRVKVNATAKASRSSGQSNILR